MKVRSSMIMTIFLLLQIFSNSFNQVSDTMQYDGHQLDEENVFLSSNNSSGNNSGNNTGGNNSGGNNTGGNNSGGNNTGGNNSGSNNNSSSDAHCLILRNLSISQTYYVTVFLQNTCSSGINYPGINASVDNSQVSGLYDTWWYLIGGFNQGSNNSNYSYYQMNWQLSFNQSVQNGTNITLNLQATVLHCGSNNSWGNECPNSSNSSITYQFQYIADDVRPLSGAIWSPPTNYTTDSTNIEVRYWAHNYTVGKITVITQLQNSTNGTGHNSTNITINMNSQVFYYLPPYSDNMANTTTNHNGTIVSVNNRTVVNLSAGWSTICLELLGDRNSNFTNCVEVYRNPPVVRLSINSATISDTTGRINLEYESENYTGYILWEYTSSNGNQYSSSYISSYQRYTHFYTDTFGTIIVCGTINNNVTECVTLSRSAREVTGFIDSPANNTQFTTSYIQIGFEANNYSNGSILVNGYNSGNNQSILNSQFEDEPYYYYNGTFINRIYDDRVVNIPYGLSTVCLELIGEDQTVLTDCIIVERMVPPHYVAITNPGNNSSFIGQYLNLSYDLQNSSSHHYTVNGVSTMPQGNSSNNYIQISVGFGNPTICVVSYDFAGVEFSDCVTVNMIDPNADSDSDGVPDHSDICPNTMPNIMANQDGCALYQLDTDNDGVMDDADICPNTQQFANVDSNGCAAYQRDSDGDGIKDNLDSCPSTPVNSVVDSYGCAISQIDTDNDGVMDDLDICPNTIVGSQVNANGCAPSQLDSDSDGVVDSFDQCPNTPIGTVVSPSGCVYTNSGNNSGNNSGSSSGDSEGMPGFEAAYLVMSVIIAGFVLGRKKEKK